MITQVEVDGFKSLSNFKLKLKRGLNILVGPNGSGKTNIILFFEFLSNIIDNPLSIAVNKVGGAGSILRKIGEKDFQKNITSKIYGSYKESSRKYICYEYEFNIELSFESDIVYFKEQVFRIKSKTVFLEDPEKERKKDKWDFVIKQYTDSNLNPKVEIETINPKKIKPRFIHSSVKGVANLKREIIWFIDTYNLTFGSVIHSLSRIGDYSYRVLNDLRGGETFNIIPSKVKQMEDSAGSPGIQKDGSGLATTLYAMRRNRTRAFKEFRRMYARVSREEHIYSPKILESIIKNVQLANKTIQKIDVENDPFNNQILVKVSIISDNYFAVLPLSALSDGTIKWLTLITAVLTAKSIFSIEEPENYLHPWMQAEIVNIMRNAFEAKGFSFILMTTHSETLLNYANAEELIVASLKEGKTIANRIEDITHLQQEISDTGFGLGHFYFSNAFANE